MTRSARLALALSFGLLALSAPPAAAQTGAAARSRALFDQARQLAEAKKWSEACPLFQAAHDLNSTGGTALQAANCYEQINKLDRALELYRFIVEDPEARKKQDRVALAEERIRVIREKLPAPPPSASAAPPPSASAAPVPPSASAPPVPPPPSASAPPVPPPPSASAPPVPPPPSASAPLGPRVPPPEEAPARSRTPAIIALGVGGAGIVAGAVAGGLALAQASDIKGRCGPTECLASDQGNRDAAMIKGWISTVGFGVGIAGVAAGVVLIVTGGGGSKKVSATSATSATVDGLVVRF